MKKWICVALAAFLLFWGHSLTKISWAQDDSGDKTEATPPADNPPDAVEDPPADNPPADNPEQKPAPDDNPSSGEAKVYSCPKCNFTSDSPGDCPSCNVALQEKGASDDTGSATGEEPKTGDETGSDSSQDKEKSSE